MSMNFKLRANTKRSMNKFGKIPAIGFGFGVLAMALSLIPNHQARGATHPPSLPDQEQWGTVKACSNATIRGSFGFTSTGTLLALPPPFAGPFAEVGRQTFDGKGNTDATATTSSNGNIVKVTIVGKYTVNQDCTGSMTLYVSPFDATVHVDFVISDDGAGLRAIVTDSGSVESRVYSKQFRNE
jgi:hypothetical protein